MKNFRWFFAIFITVLIIMPLVTTQGQSNNLTLKTAVTRRSTTSIAGYQSNIQDIGIVRLFACNFIPSGFAKCDGRSYFLRENGGLSFLISSWGIANKPSLSNEYLQITMPDLFLINSSYKSQIQTLISTTYGVNSGLFRNEVFYDTYSVQPNGNSLLLCDGSAAGEGQNKFTTPDLKKGGILFWSNYKGAQPFLPLIYRVQDSEPESILSQIRMIAGDLNSPNMMLCDGRSLDIGQNLALYNLLGTAFGGNGSSTFNLPDLPPLKTANGVEIKYYITVKGNIPQKQ